MLELCECGSLQTVARLTGGSLSEASLAAACADVLQGLRYLHEEMRTVHRDLKVRRVYIYIYICIYIYSREGGGERERAKEREYVCV